MNDDIQNLIEVLNENAKRQFNWNQILNDEIKNKLDELKFYAKWSFVMLGSIFGFIICHFIIEVFK